MLKQIVGTLSLLALAAVPREAAAQDRLKTMPGYDRYQVLSSQIPISVKPGALSVFWRDARTFEYRSDGKVYRYDVTAKRSTLAEVPAESGSGPNRGRGGFSGSAPERGRQFDSAISPDSSRMAFYRDRNLWISGADGSHELPISTEGNEKARIKYGTASWVYGEELGQSTAFWWSPDGKKLAYYRFDESQVPDYYLALNQTKLQSAVDVEAYPKPGVPNPVVDLFVYDLASKQTVHIDVRDGKPFDNTVVGHYVYRIQWSPDGKELLLHRTNRRQNILEFAACNPGRGSCRVILREEWPTGWVANRPALQYLSDGKRFIWMSERTGWRNLYLYDLSGKLITPLTRNEFEVADILRVDEVENVVYYTARDGDNHMKFQLHRVGLDGKGDRRLTDPGFNHTVTLSPDGKYFVDVAQTHDEPPVTRLMDANGNQLAELAESDVSKFDQLGLRKPEMFTYLAADGKTVLHGLISFPSNFDSTRRYPVLVPVYGGPASSSNTARETFSPPNTLTEYGFLVVNLDSRAAPGMGKRTLDAIYQKLGQVEIDDMAEGVKALWSRPYVDKDHVGIYGTSYGGYSSLMELLRHPDVFAAASVSSPRRTGATTTRSIPSATCGFPRRTRKATTRDPR
jgi:dipeptidyl-peptidase-4